MFLYLHYLIDSLAVGFIAIFALYICRYKYIKYVFKYLIICIPFDCSWFSTQLQFGASNVPLMLQQDWKSEKIFQPRIRHPNVEHEQTYKKTSGSLENKPHGSRCVFFKSESASELAVDVAWAVYLLKGLCSSGRLTSRWSTRIFVFLLFPRLCSREDRGRKRGKLIDSHQRGAVFLMINAYSQPGTRKSCYGN